mmetsp:Transcript_17716/g.31577  ORF Transcript_17716/g.31577 Transcript_17716/m.31577 type:complete len:236 (-) Transcript_17716:70-777(-)
MLKTPKPPPGWQHGQPSRSSSMSPRSPISMASSSAASECDRFIISANSATESCACGAPSPPTAASGGVPPCCAPPLPVTAPPSANCFGAIFAPFFSVLSLTCLGGQCSPFAPAATPVGTAVELEGVDSEAISNNMSAASLLNTGADVSLLYPSGLTPARWVPWWPPTLTPAPNLAPRSDPVALPLSALPKSAFNPTGSLASVWITAVVVVGSDDGIEYTLLSGLTTILGREQSEA